MGSLSSIAPILLLLIAFWFFLIRPQMRRQRELRDMQASLTKGDRVMLASGIFAEVRGFAEDGSGILVSPARGVTMKVAHGAITEVFKKEQLEEAVPEEHRPFINGDEGETLAYNGPMDELPPSTLSADESSLPAVVEPQDDKPASPTFPSGLAASLEAAAREESDYDPKKNA